MKKRSYLVLSMLLVALLALPGAATSAMWVGGEIGGNLIGSSSVDLSAGGATATLKNVKFDNPRVIGGITIGYDFVKEGFGGYNWPDWMKYFSFATDFTYNTFAINSQTVDITVGGVNFPNVPLNTIFPGARIEGYMAAWTFLFMAHYGFLPDSEVPAGRLHPYLGVGPCVLFSGIDAGSIVGAGNQSSTNIALVVEAGLRFMALKNVSLDAAFRYRYASPTYGFNVGGTTVDVSTDINAFTFLFRANYHF